MVRIVFILLLGLLQPSPALAEKRVAFVVGIDKYDNLGANAQLAKARSDARAVARLLKDLGFDLIAKEDITRSAFNSHWQDFLNKLSPGDTAAFYFAGHGVEFGNRTYLLPRDVPSVKPGRDELLRREALSLQEFLADLKDKGTRFNLVILDACRENPFEQVAGRSVGGRRGLAITEPPEGTFIMYSAGAGETALDVLDEKDRDPNSVYTRHLLPLLNTPGLTLTEVAEQVRVSVRQMAATVQHRQTPAYYNQVLGRVCLAGGDCVPLPLSVAERTWAAVKDTTSILALEAFRQQYGKDNPVYDRLAAARIEELRKQQPAFAVPPPMPKPAVPSSPGSPLTAAQKEWERVNKSSIASVEEFIRKHEGWWDAELEVEAARGVLRKLRPSAALPPTPKPALSPRSQELRPPSAVPPPMPKPAVPSSPGSPLTAAQKEWERVNKSSIASVEEFIRKHEGWWDAELEVEAARGVLRKLRQPRR